MTDLSVVSEKEDQEPIKPKATIAEITFSGGDKVELSENEKVILVGPNNSGKSQSLREIVQICQSGTAENCLVVKDLKLNKNGSSKELLEYLNKNADLINDQFQMSDYLIHRRHVQFWDNNPYLINGLHAGSIKNIAANDRLNICNQQNSLSPGQHKTKPQHILYDDELLMKRVSDLFRKAFSKDLMFDFRGGSHLPIHVGKIPKGENVVDRVGNDYVSKVRENPLLDKQGDGIKSYAGILFETVASERDITLLDEPEAFLHPPQMRRLGETLSSEAKGQLIVATHSSDILRGFLEGTKGRVRILRIQRDGDINVVYEAASETIKELWEKPELRYSNALEGIFHEQTIICEDDSDCRLINSAADYINSNSTTPFKDTSYVPTGGKHGIPKVADVLRKIGVPIKAVFDIDFLSERDLVKSTVSAFGGSWIDIEALWERVDAAVRGGIKPKSVETIKSEIVQALQNADKEKLPKGDIAALMKQGTAWNEVKKFGEIAIPNGQAQTDYKALKSSLENLGIFVIPVGEIEKFCPEIGSHGPKFVTKLLTDIPLSDSRLTGLRDFVAYIHR
ncbi:MAG: AAA family ATPase [Marinobacter sp.]|uniref:ATP-dependent nuclease n=1 Tax=Marinobacter sp. TaxID=50741 RepID=UPI001B4CE858|nr:AAA family ATPase [Marinobacter sp.]MBQ0816280.1 AAA family ATPase [Marinobacter sp.]